MLHQSKVAFGREAIFHVLADVGAQALTCRGELLHGLHMPLSCVGEVVQVALLRRKADDDEVVTRVVVADAGAGVAMAVSLHAESTRGVAEARFLLSLMRRFAAWWGDYVERPFHRADCCSGPKIL